MAYEQVPMFTDNDAFDLDRLNMIISNQYHFNEAATKIKYSAYGDQQSDQIKMITGVVTCNNRNQNRRIRWVGAGSGFFTPGIRPTGFATLSSSNVRRSTVTIRHRTGNGTILDHTGMQIAAWHIANASFKGPNYLHYLLIGY